MSKLVVIENTVVRQDAFGRYCLNDLHRAAVAQGKASESQRPSVFLRSEGINNFVQKVSEASNSASVNIIKGGLESGSWANELVAIRYAAWIEPEFEVQVYEQFRDSVKSNNGALTDKVQAGLAMIAFYKQELRIAPSGLLGAMKKLQSSLGMPDILPAYAVDAPEGNLTVSSEVTHSFTELLLLHGKPYSPPSGFKRLQLLGIVERKSRPSSKHPDKEKLFWSLTEKGLQFGKNLTDPNHPRQTQPHFYDSQFPRLLSVMMNGIAAA
ncbi:DNA-binding protein [Arsenophonus sp. ENCA]|uniref:KilA-N domain-containing protein n=1 Tax=Arsenophonus sp. ENCA TaxID=1987579 RepID=UPI000BD81214|nr:KilA-N domain-containing protein [Arsenophonus sp. ENCA]PAV01663.1 DNA-binding protein [Arsenophonus sp. ENCA]